MLLLLFLQVLGTLYIPTLTADIVNNGIVAGDLDRIWRTGGFIHFLLRVQDRGERRRRKTGGWRKNF